MSTQERELTQAAGIASLVDEDKGVPLEVEKSLIRYIWNPLADIKIVGPDGLWIRLGKGRSFYGAARAGSGPTIYKQGTIVQDEQVIGTGVIEQGAQNIPGETIEEYQARKGDHLLRCWVYPLWNIEYQETIYNLGHFTENEARAGNAFQRAARTETVRQFAGVCAADMVAMYGERYGLSVLKPLVGMDGAEQATAEELVKIVQPAHYKLTNLRQEEEGRLEDEETLTFQFMERGPAYERILGAGLDALLQRKALELLAIMRAGTRRATLTAKESWFDLLKQLNDAKLGHKGVKRSPSPWDAHVAFLLGEAVPSAVARPETGTDPQMRETIKMLGDTQRMLAERTEATVDVEDARSLLAEIRAERAALAREREALAQSTKRASDGKFKAKETPTE